MTMSVLSIPEYSLITAAAADEHAEEKADENKVVLRANDFTYFERLVHEWKATPASDNIAGTYDDSDSDKKKPFIYDPKIRKGLRAQNYAGCVLLPSGDSLEILPKIAKNLDRDSKTRSRNILLRMLPRYMTCHTLRVRMRLFPAESPCLKFLSDSSSVK